MAEQDQRSADVSTDAEIRKQLVLETLRQVGEPMDAIEVASRTLLQVHEVLEAFDTLLEEGIADKATPQVVHQRVTATRPRSARRNVGTAAAH